MVVMLLGFTLHTKNLGSPAPRGPATARRRDAEREVGSGGKDRTTFTGGEPPCL